MALNINMCNEDMKNMYEPLMDHGKDNMGKHLENIDIVASENTIAQCCDGITGILYEKNKWIIQKKKKEGWEKCGDVGRT